MTDMAINFNKACQSVFLSDYCHLWCAFHFSKAFKTNIILKVKDVDLRDVFQKGFYRLNDILEIETFEIELRVYLKLLSKKSVPFISYCFSDISVCS